MGIKGLNDYSVNMKGKIKVIHANMLKYYHERPEIEEVSDVTTGGSPIDIVATSLREDQEDC